MLHSSYTQSHTITGPIVDDDKSNFLLSRRDHPIDLCLFISAVNNWGTWWARAQSRVHNPIIIDRTNAQANRPSKTHPKQVSDNLICATELKFILIPCLVAERRCWSGETARWLDSVTPARDMSAWSQRLFFLHQLRSQGLLVQPPS